MKVLANRVNFSKANYSLKFAVLLFVIILQACTNATNTDEKIKQTSEDGLADKQALAETNIETFTVAANRVDCVGSMPMRCLVVNGTYFYDEISGFDYEEGYSYIIEVEKAKAFNGENVPADAGRFKYTLKRVLEKVKAANI